jgi:hypothetical protein
LTAAASVQSYAANLTYDSLDRPLAANWSPAATQTTPTASSTTFGFGYDGTNRRVSQTSTGNSWWYYPTAAASVSHTPNNLNQYSAVGSVTPTYDGNGNLTYGGTYTHTYGYDTILGVSFIFKSSPKG